MNDGWTHYRVGILLFTLLTAATGCDEKHPQALATPPPVVQVSLPVQRMVTDHQVFTARTQAVQSVDIKARVTGYLTKVLFTDGDEVKAGATLFQIDDRPYKATLDQSRAAVDQAKAAVEQAKASVDLTKAALVKAQADYDIGISVQKQATGAISEQELTRRLGGRDEAKANVENALAGVPKATATLEVARASLESAQLYFDWCKVTAPIAGRANTHFVDVGNLVSQNVTTLTNLVSLKPTWAYFEVDENTMRRYQEMVQKGEIRSARKNEIPVDMALAGDQGFPVKGVIDFISNQLDPNTGSIRVRAIFPNENGTLAAGLFGRIRVPISALHEALLVADSAIGTNQGDRYVLVVNDQNEVEYRVVEVGQLHSGLREVKRFRQVSETGTGGLEVLKQVEVLKPTARVIVEGLQRVRPGTKVDPKLVDMTTLLAVPKAE